MVTQINLVILFGAICLSQSLLVKVTGKKEIHCFKKNFLDDDTVTMSYMVVSEKPEKVKVVFYKVETNETLFIKESDQTGEYKNETPLTGGEYKLCFYPKYNNEFYISFELVSLYENGSMKDLAADKEVKQINENIKEISGLFGKIEQNLRYIVDRKYRHTTILNGIVDSVKKLTFLKVAIIGLLSVLQIFIVQRFFGPDKRVSNVKGAFSDKL